MEHGEFSALYRRWRAPLTLYAFSLTGEQAAAEDLVQSAFVKALLSYRGGGSIQAWLMRVLRNEWISSCRRPRMEALPEEVPSPCGDPLELLLRQEEQRRVYEAVLALRPAYRDVLLQSAVVGMTDSSQRVVVVDWLRGHGHDHLSLSIINSHNQAYPRHILQN